MRGRKILYSGERRTRPMKERVREAVFNLLGPTVKERRVLDLFAGTGAMGLEALSRGAAHATFIERHLPTVRLLEKSISAFELDSRTEVVVADTFRWSRQTTLPTDAPWVIFCCPPYDLYIEEPEAMADLLNLLVEQAPDKSLFVVETDARFDVDSLPPLLQWRNRSYPPALIAIGEKG